jgi:hypothetical protein
MRSEERASGLDGGTETGRNILSNYWKRRGPIPAGLCDSDPAREDVVHPPVWRVMAVVGRTHYKGAASDDRARIFPSPNPQPSTGVPSVIILN